MNKKVQKGLVAAVAATMGASIVAPAVQAATVDLATQYAEAYAAYEKAAKSKDQKDLTEARALLDALYARVKGTKEEYLATTLTSLLDPVQQSKFEFIIQVAGTKVEEVEQKNINEGKYNFNNLSKTWQKWFESYSSALDTVQQGYYEHVLNLVKNAKTQAELDAAKVKFADLMTMNHSDQVKAVYESTIKAEIEIAQKVIGELALVQVESVSAVNNTTFEINVALKEAVAAEKLQGTKLTLKGATEVTASFTKVDGKVAVYTVDNKGLLQPGNGSADGTYAVTASGLKIAAETTTTYSEVLVGNQIKGFVYDGTTAVAGATVEVNGRTVKTDVNGFYSVPTNSGIRAVKVTAPGYFASEASIVKVSRNYVTAQNFNLNVFDESKLFVHGVAMDDATSKPIEGATVEIFEDGVSIGTMTTGADGKYSFGNTASIADNKLGTNQLEINKNYKVVINKGLSASNFTSVYHTKVAEFKLASDKAETNMMNVLVTPVAKINSATFNLEWSTEAEKALTIADRTVANDVALTVDFLDVDGRTELLSDKAITVSVKEGKMVEAYDLVAQSQFGSAVKPCLPAGTYFLRITDSKNAVTIVPMTVTEGQNAAAPLAKVEKATSSTIDSAINSVKYQEAIDAQTTGLTLKVLGKDKAATAAEVNVKYEITQSVAGKNVPVALVDSSAFKFVESPLSIKVTSTVSNLIEGVEYTATPVQDFVRGGAVKVVSGGAHSQITASYASASKVTSVALTNTGLADGDYTVNNVKLIDKAGNVVSETGAAGTVTVATGTGTIALGDKTFKGIAPGEYKVEVAIDGYKAVVGKLDTVIDFQEAELKTEKVFEAIEKTSITGYIRFADTNGNISNVDADAEASVIIYNANGQIVAANDFGQTGVQDVYTITDGLDGVLAAGTYKMVVRGEGFETLEKLITVKANDKNIIDITVTKGAQGLAKLAVRDENNNNVVGGAVTLKDAYWVADTNINPSAKIAFKGVYDLSQSGTEWKSNEVLSKGEYSLTITSPNTLTYTDTITIKDINDTFYNTITLSNVVSGKTIDLTVKFPQATDAIDFVVVKDKNGNVVRIAREAVGTSDTVTVKVGVNATYTVEVYGNDRFIGSSTVTVQDFNKDVTVAVDEATRD